jgi:hypothetical protein
MVMDLDKPLNEIIRENVAAPPPIRPRPHKLKREIGIGMY